MHSTLPLNRRILVAFLIGDTHTLERALRPPPPGLSYPGVDVVGCFCVTTQRKKVIDLSNF